MFISRLVALSGRRGFILFALPSDSERGRRELALFALSFLGKKKIGREKEKNEKY